MPETAVTTNDSANTVANTTIQTIRDRIKTNHQKSCEEEQNRHAILHERRRQAIIRELEQTCILYEGARLKHYAKMQIEYSNPEYSHWSEDPLRQTERAPMQIPEGPCDK